MRNTGLVLEGGAMRGVYTAGVLDFFMEVGLYVPYVIGVSAGACQSLSYVSKQLGRNIKVNTSYIRDHRYLSFRNLIKEGSVFGMDFMFDEIPNRLLPFDFEAYENTSINLVFGATNCITGKADYFCNKPFDGGHHASKADMMRVCRASSSMPLAAREVMIDNAPYLDGGIADPIPAKKSISDGNAKNIIVLTRNREYRKQPSKHTQWLIAKVYERYPALIKACEVRYKLYNDTLDFIGELEKSGSAFVIRPSSPVRVKRTEKNVHKLMELYEAGYSDSKKCFKSLSDWISK